MSTNVYNDPSLRRGGVIETNTTVIGAGLHSHRRISSAADNGAAAASKTSFAAFADLFSRAIALAIGGTIAVQRRVQVSDRIVRQSMSRPSCRSRPPVWQRTSTRTRKMKTTSFAFAAMMLATAASAQTTAAPSNPNAPPGATSNAPQAGVNPSTGTAPSTGMVDRNTSTAAASGDRNQAVTTTDANAPQPAKGANSFSKGEARRRIQSEGYQQVSRLRKDAGGVWRGRGIKDGQQVKVWLDYKGNIGSTDS